MKAIVEGLIRFFNELIKTLGIERNTLSHREKFISSIGVFISMAGCYFITQHSLSDESTHLFVASTAASAVLLFAVPHGALSQPWPLIMGNLLSAIIGVTCYKYLGNTLISACIAVSISVLVMYYLNCLHPPGGATAFFAVTSGADVHALGFEFVWLVIAVNIAFLLVIAIAYNGLFHWRRYPAHLFQGAEAKKIQPAAPLFFNTDSTLTISAEDITVALQKSHSFVDATADDLIAIFESASQHAKTTKAAKDALNMKRSNHRVFKRTLLRDQQKPSI